jgi:hypothetical protein
MVKVKSKTFKHINKPTLEARPVKSFFVTMITRDISLEDAILDLLDNCIDGIRRSKQHSKMKSPDKPYQGYWAKIKFNKDSFSISDNCGGIPWDLIPYAIRLGRDPARPLDKNALGSYGIGMKRAIFKMGNQCYITTQNKLFRYKITISEEWLGKDEDWDLKVEDDTWISAEDGAIIEIQKLNPGIQKQFDENAKKFTKDLKDTIETHYAYIIEKGFEIEINDDVVKSQAATIIFDTKNLHDEKPALRPYIYETVTDDGVEVFLTVGFWRPPPDEDELEKEKDISGYTADKAGWTILCNDRAVVYCDRDILTGWGDGGVPKYHNQFIAITGIVEFRSVNPRLLPTTTTKRGLDASSPLYAKIKNKMREGMKFFTKNTNAWKTREKELKENFKEASFLSLTEIKKVSKDLQLSSSRKFGGKYYSPTLPLPPNLGPKTRRISFVKELSQIEKIGSYFCESDLKPNDVGERCFDLIYEEAKKQ